MENSKQKQKLKLLCLARILLDETDEQHMLSLQEIIDRLEKEGIHAARKALYEDFKLLQEFGIDLIPVKQGKRTCYYVGGRDFQLPELKLLVDAIQSSRFITAKKSQELIGKLENLAGRSTGELLHRHVNILNRNKTDNEKIYYAVDIIHSAIDQDRQMEFQYFRWTPQKTQELRHRGKPYRVSPWLLSWDDENYYLTAYDQNADLIKNFRVDKILEPRILPLKRQGQEAFVSGSPQDYASCLFGMFTGDLQEVLIRADNSLAGVFIDRFGLGVELQTWDERTFVARFTVGLSVQFMGWLLSFGDQIEVIAPRSLREKLLKMGENLIEVYSSQPSVTASAVLDRLREEEEQGKKETPQMEASAQTENDSSEESEKEA